MSLTLYYSPGSCALAANIVLAMGKEKYTVEKVDLGTKRLADGSDFRKINPRGQVPTLKLADGTILTQGPAILQYLGQIENLPGMNPSTEALTQAALAEALSYVSDLHGAYRPLFNSALQGQDRKATEDVVYLRLGELEDWLVKNNQPWWLGKDVTQADIYAAVVLNWSPKLGISLEKYPKVAELQKKVFALPATQTALKEESL